jgi:hypothetical protein
MYIMAEQETYQLVLPPDLDLSPSDLVDAWNADEQASSKAEIELLGSTTRGYEPALLNQVITLTTTVAVGLLTSAIYDVLKTAITKKHAQLGERHLKVTQVDQQDGSKTLVVEDDETPAEADKPDR